MKYKPMYVVKIAGQEMGYVQNKEILETMVKQKVIEGEEKNVDTIDIKTPSEYELKLVDRTLETNENEMVEAMQKNVEVTYKYYEIAFNEKTINQVNTLEEAEELVNEVKEENSDNSIDLSIQEKYTENKDEIKTLTIEVAKSDIQTEVTQKLKEDKRQKEEEERINKMPTINGNKLAYLPVSGSITSRYGVSSRLRKSTHTGLDIATTQGTPIKVVADGTVTNASYSGSYGNLVKVDHGNNLETWYAHTSKMYVKVGQKVNAGDVIAAVGSTGNSTGPHLHLEIRINGEHVNPQDYLYK